MNADEYNRLAAELKLRCDNAKDTKITFSEVNDLEYSSENHVAISLPNGKQKRSIFTNFSG